MRCKRNRQFALVALLCVVAWFAALRSFTRKSYMVGILPCKVVVLGRFEFLGKSALLREATVPYVKSEKECVMACFLRSLPLASYYLVCRCATSLLTTAVKHLAKDGKGRMRVEKVMFITNKCERDRQTKLIGCFRTSSNSSSFSNQTLPNHDAPSRWTSTKCAEFCEDIGQPFAAVPARSGCQCLSSVPDAELMEKIYDVECPHDDNLEAVSVWRTWAEYPQCETKRFATKGDTEPVGLVSFPGSGNTWTRQLLEVATGIYTGSVYNEMELYSKGFLGEITHMKNGNTIFIKDHLYKGKHRSLSEYSKVVLLIRNPFDALVAEFNRRKTHDHVGKASPDTFNSRDWSRYVIPLLKTWKSIIFQVTKSGISMKIVYFEMLQKDKVVEVKKILQFAGFSEREYEHRMKCILSENDELFRRSSSEPPRFSAGLTNLVNSAINEVRNYLFAKDCEGCRTFPNYERVSGDPKAKINLNRDHGASSVCAIC